MENNGLDSSDAFPGWDDLGGSEGDLFAMEEV